MTEEIHNAYQTLELPDGANLPQVQKAWRELMKRWHPDLVAHNPDLQRQAEEQTKQINNAYDVLKRYLKDGDIPRPRPRPSTQSQKQETQQRTRQTRSRPRPSTQSQKQETQQRTRQTRSRPRSSKQSKKQESQKQTRQTRSRPRSSKQSKKQESQKRTRQQETASEDAQSSQTHEEENRQEQTTKPFQERSLAAKIGGVIRIIFAIIFGAIIGHSIIGSIFSLRFVLDWMIEAVSGWSFIDGRNLWIETFPSKTLIIVPLLITFLGRIISAMLAENQRKFIGSAEDWRLCTFVVVSAGTFFGLLAGGITDNEIAMFIGAVLGACLGYLGYHLNND